MSDSSSNTPKGQRTSWLAVTSFWLAATTMFLAWGFKAFCRCAPFGPYPMPMLAFEAIAFTMGAAALIQIRRSRGMLEGAGWAYAGIIISLVWSAVTIHSYLRYQEMYPTVNCLNNMKQIGTAADMYAADHGGKAPQFEHWNEAILRYTKNRRILFCPSAATDTLSGYAMNLRASKVRLKDIANPSEVVLYFESVPGRNLAGGPGLFAHPPRHRAGCPVVFCDGRARLVPESEIGTLVWEPKIKAKTRSRAPISHKP